MKKTYEICGKNFLTKYPRKITCSDECVKTLKRILAKDGIKQKKQRGKRRVEQRVQAL